MCCIKEMLKSTTATCKKKTHESAHTTRTKHFNACNVQHIRIRRRNFATHVPSAISKENTYGRDSSSAIRIGLYISALNVRPCANTVEIVCFFSAISRDGSARSLRIKMGTHRFMGTQIASNPALIMGSGPVNHELSCMGDNDSLQGKFCNKNTEGFSVFASFART